MLFEECRNAGIPIKSSVRHRYFTVSFMGLVLHRHSGIVVSLIYCGDESFTIQKQSLKITNMLHIYSKLTIMEFIILISILGVKRNVMVFWKGPGL
jgi:hypothetical protein